MTVEAAAVGAEPGVAELRLGRYNGHSTLSSDWQEAVDEERWAGSVEVSVTTLDTLIARHGPPAFVKIDVEGFEAEVLAGLHRPCLRSRSSSSVPPSRLRAAASPPLEELGEYEFNLARGESHALRNGEWTTGRIYSLEPGLSLGPRGLRRRLREAPARMTP